MLACLCGCDGSKDSSTDDPASSGETTSENSLINADPSAVDSADDDNSFSPANDYGADSRDALLVKLSEKGMRLEESDWAAALREMYTSLNAAASERLPFLQPANFSLDPGLIGEVISQTSTTWFDDLPASAGGDELTELRILLDDRVVPSLMYGGGLFGMTYLRVFLGAPEVNVDYVIETFGEPTTDETVGDDRLLTYGRLRLIANPEGEILIVVF